MYKRRWLLCLKLDPLPIYGTRLKFLTSAMPAESPYSSQKNGYGDLVVMSIETYEAMTETAAVDAAISQAEAEYAQTGQLYDAHEALSSLRRKHFGTVQR